MDKKTALAAFATILLFGAVTAGGMFVFLKPSGEDEAKAPLGSAFSGIQKRPAAPEKALAAPAGWGKKPPVRARPPRPSGGSLGFIKKDKSFIGGHSGKKDTLEALAKKGDAKALVEGLRDAQEEENGSLSNRAIRDVMQKVVDAVHEDQPRWYKQFLYNKNLKEIADRYDQDNDFGAFVRLLSKSKPFKTMLKSKSKKSAMKELIGSVISDPEIGPTLKQILSEKRDDRNLIGLLETYGQNAGVPADLLKVAGVSVNRMKKKKRRSARRSRPKLRKRGFNGYDGKSAAKKGSSTEKAPPQMPPGVTPEMMEKYQKYLKK
ncbi:MAG: hypothetical protein COB53_02155 [Elusimicrobia bacterium]|nr:MAG: hypothetical protein COB53_02155 [Elusimicrobiota bacterium]